jgi:putative ABC transport system ATP-binding protein
MDTLVQLTNVSKRHGSDGSPAVAQVCMEVVRGESVAIMGPSGSGKSTLLNLIVGLDRPTGGAITVGGERVDTLSETGVARYLRSQVGVIFQFFNLLDDMTVMGNVLLPASGPACRPGRPAAAPTNCWRRCGSGSTRTLTRHACRAGSGSWWRSRGPW